MMGFIVSLLLLGLPAASTVFFIVSLVRFQKGKKECREEPEMGKRKLLLIVSAVVAGAQIAVLIGIMVLLATVLAYM